MMHESLLLMYLQNLHAHRDQRMMHQILLLMYLQNSRILSMSTFAYTTGAEWCIFGNESRRAPLFAGFRTSRPRS